MTHPSRSHLASPRSVAALVSSVTEPMCGATFEPDDPLARGHSLCDQMFMIALRASSEVCGDVAEDIEVVVSCDSEGSRALGAAFLNCPPGNVTQSMSEEVIAETLNMVAGRISASLSFSHTVGLPRRTTLAEIAAARDILIEEAILLRSKGRVDLRLWILETLPVGADRNKSQRSWSASFRSLVRRITPFGAHRR